MIIVCRVLADEVKERLPKRKISQGFLSGRKRNTFATVISKDMLCY